jgi:hypothetical protein
MVWANSYSFPQTGVTKNVLIDPREEGGDNIAKDWSPDHIPDATIFHKAPEFGHRF